MGFLNVFKKNKGPSKPSDNKTQDLDMPPLPPDVKQDVYSDIPTFDDDQQEPSLEPSDMPSRLPKELDDFGGSIDSGGFGSEESMLPPPPELDAPPEPGDRETSLIPPPPGGESHDFDDFTDAMVPGPDDLDAPEEIRNPSKAPMPKPRMPPLPPMRPIEPQMPHRVPAVFPSKETHFLDAVMYREMMDDLGIMLTSAKKAADMSQVKEMRIQEDQFFDKYQKASETAHKKLLIAEQMLVER